MGHALLYVRLGCPDDPGTNSSDQGFALAWRDGSVSTPIAGRQPGSPAVLRSAPRLAEEYVAPPDIFFGALAWYLSEHPD